MAHLLVFLKNYFNLDNKHPQDNHISVWIYYYYIFVILVVTKIKCFGCLIQGILIYNYLNVVIYKYNNIFDMSLQHD